MVRKRSDLVDEGDLDDVRFVCGTLRNIASWNALEDALDRSADIIAGLNEEIESLNRSLKRAWEAKLVKEQDNDRIYHDLLVLKQWYRDANVKD